MEYQALKNSKEEILLEVSINKTAYLLDLTNSIKDDVKEFQYVELDLEEFKELTPLTKEEKEAALELVKQRMENPTMSKEGLEQVQFFFEEALGIEN